MGDRVEKKPLNKDTDEEEAMPKYESSNKTGYSLPTHDVVRLLICEALKETKKEGYDI